jgi:hypothetical protein
MTTTGRPAAASAATATATAVRSYPPVASNTTTWGASVRRRATSAGNSASALATRHCAPLRAAGAHGEIQPGFGHIDAHEAEGHGLWRRIRRALRFAHASLPSSLVLHRHAPRDPTLRDTGSRPRQLCGFALLQSATTCALSRPSTT